MIVLKPLLPIFIILLSLGQAPAQRISAVDLEKLSAINDSLGSLGNEILDEILPSNRLRADSQFTRTLVRGLRLPYSYYYPFEAMVTAPILYPPDSSFRIITWHYTVNDADYRQRGVIQMNTPNGGLSLFPLYDYSENTESPQDSVRSPQNWIGAVYYRLIQKTLEGKNLYTLLGYDENNSITTRKWMDVLWFTQSGEPRFGGHEFFKLLPDSVFGPAQARYMIEYKKAGLAKMNYEPGEDIIMLDHLVSESNEPEKTFTLVPGGDYDGFKWNNGGWEHLDRLESQNLGDGNAPQPALILDNKGMSNEQKLIEQSEKNMKNVAPPKAEPKKAPKKPGKQPA